MVVPVLITSCQVSENLNIGPVIPQIITMSIAVIKAMGEPVALVTLLASFWNSLDSLLLRCIFFIACIVLNICRDGQYTGAEIQEWKTAYRTKQ